MINIAIVEDNVLALLALKEKLAADPDIHIKYETSNGQDILQQLATDADIQLILMDIEMPIMNGIEATLLIKRLYPYIKIIIITIYDDDKSMFEAIKSGADSYILKETKTDKIKESITDTLHGGSVMSPSIAIKTLNLLKNTVLKPVDKTEENIVLSERETEILQQLSTGKSNKIIAHNLSISPFTVKRHIENIYKKIQAHNRIDLLDKARKEGLL